eukprot:COSAG01_NODE_453_length_16866_cov_30.622175_19_plen_66_part_00
MAGVHEQEHITILGHTLAAPEDTTQPGNRLRPSTDGVVAMLWRFVRMWGKQKKANTRTTCVLDTA